MVRPQNAAQQDAAQQTVVMDISKKRPDFSSDTLALISRVKDSLDAIQGHHSDARRLLNEATNNNVLTLAGTEVMGRIERMEEKLRDQKPVAMFTSKQFLLLATFVDTSSGGQPEPNSQMAKQLLETLKRAQKQFREACQLLEKLVPVSRVSQFCLCIQDQ